MRILIALVLASFLATAAACSSGAFCDRTSKCKNQPPPDKGDGGACPAQLNQFGANCKSQNEAYLNCWLDHEVCTVDGKTDVTGTTGYAASACVSQKTALDNCVATDAGSK